MKTSQTHIIHKKKLEIKYSGGENAFALQSRAEAFCIQKLLPQIEIALNDFSGEAHIHVGEIKLEFSNASLAQLDEKLAKEIANSIKSKVSELVEKQEVKSENDDKLSVFVDALINYLQTGVVFKKTEHWFFRVDENLIQSIKSGIEEKEREVLIAVLSDDNAQNRLLNLITEKSFWRLIEHLFSINGKLTDDLLKKINSNEDIKHGQSKFKYHLQKHLLNKLIYADYQEFIAVVDIVMSDKFGDLIRLWQSITKRGETFAEALHLFKLEQSKQASVEIKFEEGSEVAGVKKNVSLVKKTEIEGRQVYVSNAGLVLLASFLPMFFKNIGLVWEDGNKQINRALNLLNYMSTGNTSCKDYELVLPKIFMGLPVETPVFTEYLISVEEKEQVAELLNAVLSHWTVLKSTSIEGLQKAFLQREGQILFKEEGDVLIVQSETVDLLLNYIPWNFRMVKLPWMKQLLAVQWGMDH